MKIEPIEPIYKIKNQKSKRRNEMNIQIGNQEPKSETKKEIENTKHTPEIKFSVGKFLLWYFIIFCIMGILYGSKM